MNTKGNLKRRQKKNVQIATEQKKSEIKSARKVLLEIGMLDYQNGNNENSLFETLK